MKKLSISKNRECCINPFLKIESYKVIKNFLLESLLSVFTDFDLKSGRYLVFLGILILFHCNIKSPFETRVPLSLNQ